MPCVFRTLIIKNHLGGNVDAVYTFRAQVCHCVTYSESMAKSLLFSLQEMVSCRMFLFTLLYGNNLKI